MKTGPAAPEGADLIDKPACPNDAENVAALCE
jgi:hypothetical protein